MVGGKREQQRAPTKRKVPRPTGDAAVLEVLGTQAGATFLAAFKRGPTPGRPRRRPDPTFEPAGQAARTEALQQVVKGDEERTARITRRVGDGKALREALAHLSRPAEPEPVVDASEPAVEQSSLQRFAALLEQSDAPKPAQEPVAATGNAWERHWLGGDSATEVPATAAERAARVAQEAWPEKPQRAAQRASSLRRDVLAEIAADLAGARQEAWSTEYRWTFGDAVDSENDDPNARVFATEVACDLEWKSSVDSLDAPPVDRTHPSYYCLQIRVDAAQSTRFDVRIQLAPLRAARCEPQLPKGAHLRRWQVAGEPEYETLVFRSRRCDLNGYILFDHDTVSSTELYVASALGVVEPQDLYGRELRLQVAGVEPERTKYLEHIIKFDETWTPPEPRTRGPQSMPPLAPDLRSEATASRPHLDSTLDGTWAAPRTTAGATERPLFGSGSGSDLRLAHDASRATLGSMQSTVELQAGGAAVSVRPRPASARPASARPSSARPASARPASARKGPRTLSDLVQVKG